METDASEHVTNVVNFILNNCDTKVPMKMPSVLAVLQHDKKLLRDVFQSASTALQEDYGIIVKILPDSSSGKKFICSSEKNWSPSLAAFNKTEQRQLVLLHVVLTFLLIKGNRATETKLKSALEALDIHFDRQHEYFGDVKTLITETFVKQMYLKKEKPENADGDNSYSWGFRSEEEFDKINVIAVTAKTLGKPAGHFDSFV